jgi:hypothetical protein
MNRFDLQKMAEERVADAAALLDAGRFQASYYLCGYAIECALKACIARKTREFDFPDRKLANDSYVHDLTKLLKVAAMDGLLQVEEGRNHDFATNWAIVKDWSEASRYNAAITAAQASVFFLAVTDESNGVLSWLKTTVVKEALNDEMKCFGASLTRALDDAGWPIVAAFWYFESEEISGCSCWRHLASLWMVAASRTGRSLTLSMHLVCHAPMSITSGSWLPITPWSRRLPPPFRPAGPSPASRFRGRRSTSRSSRTPTSTASRRNRPRPE